MSDDLPPLRAPAPARLPPDAQAPTLSVLVPAFNAAGTIGEAIESALVQRPEPHEVIVSDDGSEDELGAALRPFAGRIKILRGPHAGLAAARNRAAAAAGGSLLGLLDADDVWLPGRGRSLVAAARLRPDLDIVTTDAFVVRGSDREPTTYYEQRGWPDGDQVDAILLSSFVFGAAAIRRTAYERVGGYDEQVRFAEDWDLWIRLLVTGSRAGLVDAPLYEYRRRTDSLTGRRVDLAKGVVAMLGRVPVGALTEDQRKTLRRTRAQWRLRAARDAATARDPRRWRLAASAAAERNARARDRISVLRSLLRG